MIAFALAASKETRDDSNLVIDAGASFSIEYGYSRSMGFTGWCQNA
jgi:hypothetical protein